MGCDHRPIASQPEPSTGGGGSSNNDGSNSSGAGSEEMDAGNEVGDAGEPTPVDGSVSVPFDPEDLCASCGGCEETLPVLSAFHTDQPVNYTDHPPASGDHNGCWASWAEHTSLPAEFWVHNLEHGGVVLLHNCGGNCDAELTQMRAFLSAHPRTLMTEYTLMPERFALVSWGHRLVADCWDAQAAQEFYEVNFNHGREDVAAGPPTQCAMP